MKKAQIRMDLSKNLPDIWGEGAILGFSGMDGSTDTSSGFIATLDKKYGLLFHTPKRRWLKFSGGKDIVPRTILSDSFIIQVQTGLIEVVFADCFHLVGNLPVEIVPQIDFEGVNIEKYPQLVITHDETQNDWMVLFSQKEKNRVKFCLSYGRTKEEAITGAHKYITIDVGVLINQRLNAYARIPRLKNKFYERFARKCFNVMKVNTLAPEGIFKNHWSTPDRVPHKMMWLWDSVFHSLGMRHLDPYLAWEFIKSVLDCQCNDGMIPHNMCPDGTISQITQPPILAWGLWEVYRILKDKSILEYSLPRLEKYIKWDLANRDKNCNGLLEWYVVEIEECRCGESGLDNSPRFDKDVLLDSVDFSVFAACDMEFIFRIAQELDQKEKARYWLEKSLALARKIEDYFWDEETGFYYDRDLKGNFVKIKAGTGFLPLLLKTISPERVKRLISHLKNPKEFAAEFPVPSVAIDEPSFSKDMWRGPAWANIDYLIISGLKKQSQHKLAQELSNILINQVLKYYEKFGVIFEFYDALDEIPPTELDRKGKSIKPYDIRIKLDAIRDYHWTAALIFSLLLEK